jgi:hypothetical protein
VRRLAQPIPTTGSLCRLLNFSFPRRCGSSQGVARARLELDATFAVTVTLPAFETPDRTALHVERQYAVSVVARLFVFDFDRDGELVVAVELVDENVHVPEER